MAKTNEAVSEKAAEDLYFAVEEAKQWIQAVTGRQILGEFREALEDGAILCELINNIKPGCIRKINMKNVAIAHLDNLKQFLTACENIGLKDSQLFDLTDLQAPGTLRMKSGGVKHTTAERRLRNVVITLYWLGRKVSQLPTYKGPQLNLEAFHDILDIPNQSYYLKGYDDNPEPIQHGGRIRSKGDVSLRQAQPANKDPIKKDPQQNGLNKEQELTADELLANIQSAVDELLHQYHPENEPLANGSHELAPQPDKQTVKVSPTKDGSPVPARMHSPPLSSSFQTDPTTISLTVTIPAKSGSFGLQIIGGANTALPAQIELLLPGGPAESSGLQPGDLIVSVDGHDVSDHDHVQLISLIRQSSAHGRMTLGVVRHLPELFQEESSHPIKRTESSILWEEEHLERERQQREVAMLYRNPPSGASTKKEEVDSIDLEDILDEELQGHMSDTSKTLDELQQQLQALNDLTKKRPSPGYDSSARSSVKPVDMQKDSDDDVTPVASDEEEQNEPIRGQGEGREADIDPVVQPENLPTDITEDVFAPLKFAGTESGLLTEVLSAHSSFNGSLPSNVTDRIVHNNVQPKESSVTTIPSPSDVLKQEPSPKVRQFSTPNARVVSVEYDDTFEEISGIKVKAVQRTRWTPETRTNRKATPNRSTSITAGPNTFRDHRGYERHEVVMMEPRGRSLSYGAPESHKVQNIRPSSGQVDRNKPPNCSHCRSPITQGPMMSIPGRKLNFHSKCLLCVVCRSPLTMGYGHTTVFLRHSLPHCASCYSTDNGIKATTC